MEGKVMPFSIDFLSILSATLLALLSFVVGIIFTVYMLGGEKLVICIIISAVISWVVYFLVALYGKKSKRKETGRQLQQSKEK
jgi:prepilin signal peptidase PulO-like enzyme (type II secretory pathway)